MKVLAFPPKALVVLGTLIAALVAVPAVAQINPAQVFSLAGGHAYRNNVAYDPINQVYMVIVQRPPVTARFYDKNGAQIGQDLVIASEGGYNAWASVAFGGTSNDPVFLVTYIVAQGNNPKFGRLVRFNSGAPWVTAPSFIVDVGSEWTYAEKAQNVWMGNQFIVGSRVKNAGASFPTFQVNHFDMNGGVSGGVDLGDGADYYGAPAIACVPGSTCLAVGYMAGIPTGYTGGSYGRLFHGPSLGPQGGLFFLSAGMVNEDQGVVFQAHLGRFLTQWFRGSGPGYIDTRIVGTDGSMSALDLNRGIGPEAGTNAAAYNPITRTTLLLTKLTGATLWAIELGDDGYPRDPNNWLVQTMWDGLVLDYLPSIAANSVDGHWLVTWELQNEGFGRVVRSGGGTGQKAQLTSPAAGSTLTGSAATFQWTTGSGVAQYWLYVGSSPGAFDIANRNMGGSTSTALTGLPMSGQALYVRLHSLINGAWQFNDYTLTAATQFSAQKAQLVSPAPGSTLTDSTVSLQWAGGAGVAQYWVYIGSTPGAFDIANRDMGLQVSAAIAGMPVNGSTLYVRLHSLINGAWQFNDYTLTAANVGGQKAQLTSPAGGSTLTGSAATFQWTAGSGVAQYWLYIGSSPGTYDIANRNMGSGISTVVNGMPINGQTLYVRLHSLINGGWQFNDYTLTAALPALTSKAQLLTPAPGSNLNSTNVAFQWSAGTVATQYWLYVGTAPGAWDLVNRDMGVQLSTVVGGIPVNGSTLYVRLHSLIGGAWQFNDYTLMAPLIPGVKAQLISPGPGSTLSSTTVNFQWTGGTSATQYWLYIGSAPGAYDIVNRNLNTTLSTVVNGLPSGGQPIYVRLHSLINGAWQFNDYVLTATGGG